MMRMVIALFIGLALCITTKAQDSVEAVQARAMEILPWVAQHTGYKADHVKPRIVFKTSDQLQHIYYGEHYDPSYIKIAAITVDQAIMLRDDFKLGVNDDTLAHELTHVLQHANGHFVGTNPGDFKCLGDMEKEAYLTQNAWIDEFHVGTKVEELWLLLLTICDDPAKNRYSHY